MEEFISKIKQIKKEVLDEREFYEQVLGVISGLENVSLTPETAEQLKVALQEIGCMEYDDWKKQKEENGEIIKENNMGKGIEQADISSAVSFVSQLLDDYENASFSLSYMLDGGEKYGWVQQWLKNSKELYPKDKEEIRKGIDSHLTSLKEIKKEKLDEREFYEQVLGVISGMEDVSLTPEMAEQLKVALQEIGCMKYDDWKAQKVKDGEAVIEGNIGEGIERGYISTAVSFVSQLLGSYKNAKFSLPYMLDGGEKYGWVQQWLTKSKELPKNGQEITDKYTNIEQIRSEIESLGDWKDSSQRDSYLKVISKIISVYHGYELDDGKRQYYPEEVTKAIADICSKKFPSKDEVFKDGKLRPGMPDNEFSNYVTLATTPLGISLLGERTRIDQIAREKFGIDVYHTQMTEEESKKLIESSEQYLVQNLDKSNIPYYKVAKQALMNWNGLSEEEADKIISEQTFSQLEGQVYAKGSMDYAIESIAAQSSVRKLGKESELADFVYNGGESAIIDDMKKDAEFMNDENMHQWERNDMRKKYNNMIMNTLFAVHDGWVQDNVKKFNAREKKHQHMPSELIGWKEAKADLLFVRPIFETAGIEVNEEELEQVYNGRVKDFFLNRGIKTARNLSDSITQGEEFYPALKGYGEILTTINDPEYVDEKIIPAIEQQGIGNIEEVRRNIVSQIISNPVTEDVEKLSDEEKSIVEQALEQEVSTLTAQRDELQQKNSIVQRIMVLANRRKSIKKEISIEEQRKSENLHEFDN